MKASVKDIKLKGGTPASEDWVIGCDASERWRSIKKDISPTLVHSRPQGYWISSRARRMTAEETFRLQGLSWPRLGGDTSGALRAMVGNVMAVPLIETIVVNA